MIWWSNAVESSAQKVTMAQFKYLAINILATVTAVWCTNARASLANALEVSGRLCEASWGESWNSELYSRPYAWQTLNALMSAVDVDDCATAVEQLVAVRVLRGPQLQTDYLPNGGLMVDFPIGIDLQVIAIATPNLTELNLNGRVIHDLTPITALSQLQTLRLANTQLNDISPLVGLEQLTTLDVSYNQLDSIAPIAAMSTVRSLNIAYNPVTDISPIGAVLTPETEVEWQLLDLSGIDIDTATCPENLGDICGDSSEGAR